MPAVVETPLAHADRPDFDERKVDMAQAYPLRRLGQPDDVARAIAYLASPRSGVDQRHDRRRRRGIQRDDLRHFTAVS